MGWVSIKVIQLARESAVSPNPGVLIDMEVFRKKFEVLLNSAVPCYQMQKMIRVTN
jgi:hypothetical protein